jgi:hypothetical protein
MAEPIQVDFSGKGNNRGRRFMGGKKTAAIPPERAGLRLAVCIVGTVLVALVGYYVLLPPLNWKANELYYYLALVIAAFIALVFLTSNAGNRPEYVPYARRTSRAPLALLALVGLFFAGNLAFSSPFFHALRYSKLMPINQEANFSQDIQEPNFSAIPKLDESAAHVVADRALGDLADDVSQFTISESNTQINYQSKPVRVVTLSYASIIKWLTNTSKGLPGYVIVDMANEQSEFVRLKQSIRYSDAEHFSKLLKRHLRFQYPTYLFGAPNFEIDDARHPYWVVPRMDKTVGLLGGEDVIGIVLVDAVTGKSVEHSMQQLRTDKSLQWIDRVYNAGLLNTQFNFYGKYNKGFWNSVLGQKNVKVTTAGYNYLAKDDDVYMYTGVTSVTGDQSIIGFIMVNQRTKAASYYRVKGANESSAQTAAQGLVQAQGWVATFPLLINVSGQPTYFLSLKDDSGVVQGYSMVNVIQYNKIKVWSETLEGCTQVYQAALLKYDDMTEEAPQNDATPQEPDDGFITMQGTVADIRTAVIDGNTTYFFDFVSHDSGARQPLKVTAKELPAIVFIDKGAEVELRLSNAGLVAGIVAK